MSAEQVTVMYREIPGFPGYRVGDDGSVWTRRHTNGTPADEWNPLKPQLRKRDGRHQVGLHTPNGYRMIHVHTLVLTTFVGPRPAGMQCCHWDGNKTNNALSNLRWDTPKANAADKIRHGVAPYSGSPGEKNPNARLTSAIVSAIRMDHSAGLAGYKKLAKKYGVNQYTIRSIIKRRNWAHTI